MSKQVPALPTLYLEYNFPKEVSPVQGLRDSSGKPGEAGSVMLDMPVMAESSI